MIFLSSVAATLVFFDHSGDIIHINISTSVGVRQTLQYTQYKGSILTIFLCRIMIFLSSVAATLVFFDHNGDIIHINISTSVTPTEVSIKDYMSPLNWYQT